MTSWYRQPASRIITAGVLLLSLVMQFGPQAAEAATGFQQAYLRLDRMKISTATGGTVCAQPASTATEAKVLVTFPASFTVNTTASNWTVTTTNLPAGSTVWPGINTATTVSSQTVTFPSSDLTVGTIYCFNFTGTSTLTTAASAGPNLQGVIETQTSGSVVIDSTSYATATIADDQIVVSAVVPPSFYFTLSGNTDTFTTNLDPASVVSTTGRQVTITTNAKGGWIAWAKDTQQGLYSATTNYKINTAGTVNGAPSSLTGGTEGYVLDTDVTTDAAGGCTVASDAEYNGTGTSQGGTFSANFQPVASCTGASPATSNGDIITLIERAAIAGATPAGTDYTDVITVVGAGNF